MFAKAIAFAGFLAFAPAAAGASSASPLAVVLARHRAAVGGDLAVKRAARMRIRWTIKMYGLLGSAVDTVDHESYRHEVVLPAVEFSTVDILAKNGVIVRGTNGDVRVEGQAETARRRTEAALLSLDYLRPHTRCTLGLLDPIDEDGIHYERISVAAIRGSSIEIWLDQDGLARRRIGSEGGLLTSSRLDDYAEFQGLRLPRVERSRRIGRTQDYLARIAAVEFPKAISPESFVPGPPRVDAQFPSGVHAVTTPLSLILGRLVAVHGSLGGRVGTFLVDTGASSSAYDREFVIAAGATPKGELPARSGFLHSISLVRAPDLQIGDLRIGPQTVVAVDLHDNPEVPPGIDGILGYDFVSRFPFSIDYPDSTMTFWAPGSYKSADGEVAIPFELENTLIVVPVSINGQPAGRFELDTGNAGSCAIEHAPGAATLKPGGRRPYLMENMLRFGTGSASAYLIHVDLGVGQPSRQIFWREAPVDLLALDDPAASTIQGDGNLGYEWLRQLRVTFDYGTRTLYVLQRLPFRRASAIGRFGISAIFRNGRTMVDNVVPGWPADRAGLRTGDELVSVEGVTTQQAGPTAWRLLSMPASPGETRQVAVRRAGRTLQVQVTAETGP